MQKRRTPTLYQYRSSLLAPQVRLELTTLRLTAECSAIELLRIIHLSLCVPRGLRKRIFQRTSARFQPLPFPSSARPSSIPPQPSGFTLPPRFSLFLPHSPLLLEAGKTSVSPAPFGSRRLPTLPGRSQPSTISVWRLNFCVRYGYRWFPPAIVTGNFLASAFALLAFARFAPASASLPHSRSLRPSGFAPLPHAPRASASLSPRTFKTAQV